MAKYKFYHTDKWRKLRQLVINRAGGICEICNINKGTIAHHIIWVDDSNCYDPNVVWNIDNLQCVCQDCHNKIHMKVSSTAEGYIFADGELVYVGK